jgi:hypothetical protein
MQYLRIDGSTALEDRWVAMVCGASVEGSTCCLLMPSNACSCLWLRIDSNLLFQCCAVTHGCGMLLS